MILCLNKLELFSFSYNLILSNFNCYERLYQVTEILLLIKRQWMDIIIKIVGYTSWADRILFAATILGIISLVSYKRKGAIERERERE